VGGLIHLLELQERCIKGREMSRHTTTVRGKARAAIRESYGLGAGLGLLVSQLKQLHAAPIARERISEAAGVNSAAGSFGLSFGLAMAGGILLAVLALSFTNLTEESTVIPPASQELVADKLEDDAQVMSTTQLNQLLADESEPIQEEILRINTDATDRSLQVALLVPILASLLGLFNAFRMRRLPEAEPAAAMEAATLG
jgi:hypothetical protein